MAHFKDVKKQIDEYKRLYSDVISHAITQPETIESFFKPKPRDYPLSGRHGVYFVFNENLELLYIGKASGKNTLGRCLCDWFGNKHYKLSGSWIASPCYVSCVSTNNVWEVASLEEYLIYHLRPSENYYLGKKP